MLVHVCSCVPPVWSWLVKRESDPVDSRGGGVWQPGLQRVFTQRTPADVFQGFNFTAFWKPLFICRFAFIPAFTKKLWKVFDAFVCYRCMTMGIQSLIPKNFWASWSIMRVHWTSLTQKIYKLTHYWGMVQASPSQYVDLPFKCMIEIWVLQFKWESCWSLLLLSLRSLCVDALIELSDENADWKLSLREFVNCLTPTYHPYERSKDKFTRFIPTIKVIKYIFSLILLLLFFCFFYTFICMFSSVSA